MKMNLDLSIVIINYNTFSITSNCIRSIYKNTSNLSFEIILVDNGSAERNPDDFLIEFSELRLIKLRENIGFGRGNNEGIKAAKASTILLINSDTLVIDNAIKTTYDFLFHRHDIGMVGCRLINDDGSEQASSFVSVRFPLLNVFINTSNVARTIASFFPIFKKYTKYNEAVSVAQKQTHRCDAISGAFMMFKDDHIRDIGYFDPDFFLYCEDTEWCRNRITKKTDIYYFASASVIHLGGKSSNAKDVQMQTMLSLFLYAYKVGLGTYFMFILIHFMGYATNFFLLPFMATDNREREWNLIVNFFSMMDELFYNIPRYKRQIGSRPIPLKAKAFR